MKLDRSVVGRCSVHSRHSIVHGGRNPAQTFSIRQPAVLFAVLLQILACQDSGSGPASSGDGSVSVAFVDRANETGLDFNHFNGMSGEYYLGEIMGAGGALFDYDDDGDLDVYLVQGRMLGGVELSEALLPAAEDAPLRDRMFRNDLTTSPGGRGLLRFSDVTDASGIEAYGYGMGVAAGDYDGDSRVDLYVTNLGANQLWRNAGDGTFSDATAESGTDDSRWSTSAAFVDFDHDGLLDLYVVNYVDFRIASHKVCSTEHGAPEYCGPSKYRPETDRLLRNLGDGTFADVSSEVGLIAAPGPGLGVVSADFDGNGWIDIYVANDQTPNKLWMNQGEGHFREEGMMSGSAVDAQGRVQASMGVDAGDVDGDGDEDLFMTHLLMEVNTLYVNDGSGLFFDRTAAAGLGPPSMGLTGFGTALLDVDNDGWLDLVAVNGAVRTIRQLRATGDPLPLEQPNQLFLNRGGRFVNASAQAPVLALPHVSRGAAVGDVDEDGDPDVLICNNSGPVQLLVNQTARRSGWLGLRLVGRTGRDMVGAVATLVRDGEAPLVRRSRAAASYLASSDPRLLFGLGDSEAVTYVEVLWPSGLRERWRDLAPGRYHTLVEGSGEWVSERVTGEVP